MNTLLRVATRRTVTSNARTAKYRAVSVQARRSLYTIEALQARFRDPTSPFHLPPGTTGPESPDPPEEELTAEEEGCAKLAELGYDPDSFWEQKIVWGDHDAFQHVNNVRYIRFFESGRIHWMRALGHELGGPQKSQEMIAGKGVSLILKSLSVEYRRPVVYPDTLLVAHRPHPGPRPSKTHFGVKGAMWSYAQRRIVTECDSVLVWYDYDRLTKCDPGEAVRALLERRMRLRQEGDEGAAK
ncbi:Thioesterase/thiol ester dehydrase-isomerase [Epithele typhae]|uniref:Thioesterase/thiol ester dehydrase-isomerase n=1 Tax=Epithele typhae TaxID=378194 RepID=UPI0020083B35|nr:Thioesterase/thiol ester dehydrase-isomerase [Epithele typhae]KAH9940758.1 Thioesterase/thiol ester dehydrase-isomerase [Epithele typhae]